MLALAPNPGTIGGSEGIFNLVEGGQLDPAEMTKLGADLKPIASSTISKLLFNPDGSVSGTWQDSWLNNAHTEAQALWIPHGGPSTNVVGPGPGHVNPDATLSQYIGAILTLGSAGLSFYQGGVVGYGQAAISIMEGHADLIAVAQDLQTLAKYTAPGAEFGDLAAGIATDVTADGTGGVFTSENIQDGTTIWNGTDYGGDWGAGEFFDETFGGGGGGGGFTLTPDFMSPSIVHVH
jgi:hypothetical protein